MITAPWAIRALIASSLVGVMCGVIGAFMVLRNMSLIGDALAHAILPGVVVAFIVVGYSSIGFFAGTLLAAIGSAIGITWIQENVKTKNDAAIGIIFTAMFSIGVIGISSINNEQGVHLDLRDFLFGTIMGVSNEDLIITAMVTVYAILSIAIFYRHLFITTFQPTIAATMGISVKMIHYFLMLLLSFAVVVALRSVGMILVVAMLITPSAAALLLSNKLKRVLVLSGIFGLSSAVLGLLFAIVLNTTPGPAMCVVATLIYFLAVFFSPSKGLVFKYIRKRRQAFQIQKEDIIKYLYKNPKDTSGSLTDMTSSLTISPNRIASHLKQLRKDGYIVDKGSGKLLTAKGTQLAENLLRAHRLWETYLVDEVGLRNTEIHEEAEKFEHLLNTEILDQVDAKLGFPSVDPHGSPIPGKKLTAQNPLLKEKPNAKVRISKSQINSEIESKLWELGLTADKLITVESIHKKEVAIKVDNRKLNIPAELANLINVN